MTVITKNQYYQHEVQLVTLYVTVTKETFLQCCIEISPEVSDQRIIKVF